MRPRHTGGVDCPLVVVTVPVVMVPVVVPVVVIVIVRVATVAVTVAAAPAHPVTPRLTPGHGRPARSRASGSVNAPL